MWSYSNRGLTVQSNLCWRPTVLKDWAAVQDQHHTVTVFMDKFMNIHHKYPGTTMKQDPCWCYDVALGEVGSVLVRWCGTGRSHVERPRCWHHGVEGKSWRAPCGRERWCRLGQVNHQKTNKLVGPSVSARKHTRLTQLSTIRSWKTKIQPCIINMENDLNVCYAPPDSNLSYTHSVRDKKERNQFSMFMKRQYIWTTEKHR